MLNVWLVLGFDGRCGISFEFLGKKNSFIEFFNFGKLDMRMLIIIFVWIYYQGWVGFIFNYYLSVWGVYFWMVGCCVFFVCFMKCRIKDFIVVLVSKIVKCSCWQYVGVFYDYVIGIVKLFVGGRMVVKKCIGRIRLVINYFVRMGVWVGDGRYFCGRIFCF